MDEIQEIRQAYKLGRRREERVTHSGQVWWLEESEVAAERAAEAATNALRAAEMGQWDRAVRCAKQACRREMAEFGQCRCWRPLLRAIRTHGKSYNFQ